MKKFSTLLLALACAAGTTAAAQAAPAPQREGAARQRYIVRWDSPAAEKAQSRLAEIAGDRIAHRFNHVFDGAVLEMTAQRAAALARNKHVLSVELDRVISIDGVQTSPPANLDRVDQRGRSLTASYTSSVTGKGVKIYVIDTGLNLSHTDFTGRVVNGPNFVQTGILPTDCNGHGTHVAGIAAGTRHGVAKSATVVPIKVLDCDGNGTVSATLKALDWVVANHTTGPAVVNMSLGAPALTTVDAAVQAALKDRVTVVAAAGNIEVDEPLGTSHNACDYSPARVRGVLAVANATNDDRQSYSYAGPCVDLFAPGTGVVSDYRGGTTATATMTGTSMAAPHVSGASALVLQARPTWTAAEVAHELNGKSTKDAVRSISANTPNRLLYTLGGVTPGMIEVVGRPSATGTPAVGNFLSSPPGTWGKGTVRLARQWYRISSTGAATAIAGATASTYRVTTADRRHKLQVRVTGSKPDYLSRTANSAVTATVK